MDDKLATPAHQVNSFNMAHRTVSGELRLEEGFIAFTSEDGRLVFRAPLQEVRASFPKAIFLVPPIPYFGIGIKLTIHGNSYLLSFVPVTHEIEGSRLRGYESNMSVSSEDIKPARAAVRQWRAALSQPTKVAPPTRCRECGAETVAAARVCAQCGAPLSAP